MSSFGSESERKSIRLTVILIALGTLLLLIFLVPQLILLTLSIAIFAPGVVWVLWWPRHLRRQALQGIMGGRSAIEILRERYASGEITKDEFDGKMKDLQEQV